MSGFQTRHVVAQFIVRPTDPRFTLAKTTILASGSSDGTAHEAFTAAVAATPERTILAFTVGVPAEFEDAAIEEYVDDLLADGLDGAPLAEHNAPGSARYDIVGPEVTGHENVYTARDRLRGQAFGHSPDEPVAPGVYDDLPSDFADSEY